MSFDYLYVDCPTTDCSGRVEFQSKAGPCDQDEYTMFDAPPEVLADLHGVIENCEKCRRSIIIRATVSATAHLYSKSRKRDTDVLHDVDDYEGYEQLVDDAYGSDLG